MQIVACLYFFSEFCCAECCYSECHHVECRYSQCHCAKCRYAVYHYASCNIFIAMLMLSVVMLVPCVIILNATMLSLILPNIHAQSHLESCLQLMFFYFQENFVEAVSMFYTFLYPNLLIFKISWSASISKTFSPQYTFKLDRKPSLIMRHLKTWLSPWIIPRLKCVPEFTNLTQPNLTQPNLT